MKIFDFNDPRHVQILREELARAKKLMIEGNVLNNEEIWTAMPDQDRFEVVSGATDDVDEAERLSDPKQPWSELPDEISSNIDLAPYQLARKDIRFGEPLHRGIIYIRDVTFKDDVNIKNSIQKLIELFCLDVDRKFDDLTSNQAMDLNIKVQKLVDTLKPAPQIDKAADDANKAADLAALRAKGIRSGLD